MKTINEGLIPLLESSILKSLKVFESKREENYLSDLYLRFDADNVIMSIYDDIENKLLEVNLEKEQEDDPEKFNNQLIPTLKHVLFKQNQEKIFDREFIFKPFAISIVDDDFIVSEELIFIDDNTLKLDGDLLVNLDKDLDDFLKNLMK